MCSSSTVERCEEICKFIDRSLLTRMKKKKFTNNENQLFVVDFYPYVFFFFFSYKVILRMMLKREKIAILFLTTFMISVGMIV